MKKLFLVGGGAKTRRGKRKDIRYPVLEKPLRSSHRWALHKRQWTCKGLPLVRKETYSFVSSAQEGTTAMVLSIREETGNPS